MDIKQIIGDYKSFVKDLLFELESEGFDLDDFAIMDHICYRVETLDDYHRMHDRLTEFGTSLMVTQVNNRPISTFKLHSPLRVDRWRIDALELPAPKPGRAEVEGLEHVELVIYDTMDQFRAKYADKDFESKAVERGINPELGFKLPSGKGVKFHLVPLTAVVQLESLLGVQEVKDGKSGI